MSLFHPVYSVFLSPVVDTTKAHTLRTPRYGDRTESIATDIVSESLATERASIRSRTVRSITDEISVLRSRRLSGRAVSDSSIAEEEHLKK